MADKDFETNEQELEYGTDLITLVDDEGAEHEFEFLDSIELDNGDRFVALVPVFDDAEEALQDSAELTILQVEEVDGEELLSPIQDEATFDKVADMFMQRLSEEFDFEE